MNHSELSWITRLVAGAELDQANTALEATHHTLQQTRAALAEHEAARTDAERARAAAESARVDTEGTLAQLQHRLEAAELERQNAQGYVTSVCWSATLSSHLGLGFLRDGRARHGQELRLVDHLRGIDTIVRVVDPVFFDKEGTRARG